MPILRKRPFENIVGKGKIAGYHNVFYTMFSTLLKKDIRILANLNLSSANAFNFVRAQI